MTVSTVRIASFIALGLALSAHGARAQEGIKVKQGEKFTFRIEEERTSTRVAGGRESTQTNSSTERSELAVVKVAAKKIDWSFRTIERKDNGEDSKSETGSKNKPEPVGHFTTDRAGTITEVTPPPKKLAGEGDITVKLGAEKTNYRRFFVPALAEGKKPGDSWTEEAVDTVNESRYGMVISTKYITTFHYAATVDTLGAKAARIEWESGSITFDGMMAAGGMEMKIDGEGAGSGVSYISLTDGVLVAATRDLEGTMQVVMPQMVIPVTIRTKMNIVRN